MLEILFWGLVSWCHLHLPAWGEPRPNTDQFLHLMTRVLRNTKSFGFGGILQSIQITVCPYKQKLLVLPSNLASFYVLRCLMLVLVRSLFATFKEGTGTFHIFTLHYITYIGGVIICNLQGGNGDVPTELLEIVLVRCIHRNQPPNPRKSPSICCLWIFLTKY